MNEDFVCVYLQKRINAEAIHYQDPYTQRPYNESSFATNLRRRGSYDLSYLDQAMDPAFLARHMMSYMKSHSEKREKRKSATGH